MKENTYLKGGARVLISICLPFMYFLQIIIFIRYKQQSSQIILLTKNQCYVGLSSVGQLEIRLVRVCQCSIHFSAFCISSLFYIFQTRDTISQLRNTGL